MMRVFQSEWYRLVRGKMLPISTGLVALFTALNYLIMRLVIFFDLEGAADLSRELMGATGSEYLATSMVQGLSGGTIYIILSVIVANLMTEELKEGTLKYSLLMRDRIALYSGKLLTLFSLGVLMALVIGLTNLLVATVGFQAVPQGGVIVRWAVEVGAAALTFTGYMALLLLLFSRIKHTGAAIGIGIALYIGMSLFEMLLPGGLSAVLFTRVTTWLGEGAYGKVFLQAIVYTVGFGLLGLYQFKNKEITS